MFVGTLLLERGMVSGGEPARVWEVCEPQWAWSQLHTGGDGCRRDRSYFGVRCGFEGVEGDSRTGGGERVRPPASEPGGSGVQERDSDDREYCDCDMETAGEQDSPCEAAPGANLRDAGSFC